jgi:uncharacterized OB-fold protein
MTSIIERHYQGLAQDELRAHRCRECNRLTFPMTTCCVDCGSFEWDEETLAGTGTLLFASHNVAPATHPRFAELAPYVYAHVMLDEGIVAQGILQGVDPTPEAIEAIFDRGPQPVRLDVLRLPDLPVIAFRLLEP